MADKVELIPIQNILADSLMQWTLSDPEDLAEFISCDPDELIKYHHNVGQFLRNEIPLWNSNSLMHPDNASFVIIQGMHWLMTNCPFDQLLHSIDQLFSFERDQVIYQYVTTHFTALEAVYPDINKIVPLKG